MVLGLIPSSVSGVMGFVTRDLEVLALPRRNVVDVHPVEFFESAPATFDDAEVDDEDTEEETAGKHISVGKVDLSRDEGREETDKEVPEPVAGGGQGHTLRTVLRGEQFGGNSPDHRTPCHGIA